MALKGISTLAQSPMDMIYNFTWISCHQTKSRHYKLAENPNLKLSISRLIGTQSVSDCYTQEEFTNLGEGLHRDYGAESILRQAIINGKPIFYKPTFCKAHLIGRVFDPLHNLYPCWELVGNKSYVIGDYIGGEIHWHSNAAIWHNHNVSKMEPCTKCPAALICGGGCLTHNLQSHECMKMVDLIHQASIKTYQDLITPNNP